MKERQNMGLRKVKITHIPDTYPMTAVLVFSSFSFLYWSLVQTVPLIVRII